MRIDGGSSAASAWSPAATFEARLFESSCTCKSAITWGGIGLSSTTSVVRVAPVAFGSLVRVREAMRAEAPRWPMALPERSMDVRLEFCPIIRAIAEAPSSPMALNAISSVVIRVRVEVARRQASSAATKGPKSGPWPEMCADWMWPAEGSRSITISSSSRLSASMACCCTGRVAAVAAVAVDGASVAGLGLDFACLALRAFWMRRAASNFGSESSACVGSFDASSGATSGGSSASSHSGMRIARSWRSMRQQNSSKSTVPDPSASTSSIRSSICFSDGCCPSWRNIRPSSLKSTSPPPSRSNIWKVRFQSLRFSGVVKSV